MVEVMPWAWGNKLQLEKKDKANAHHLNGLKPLHHINYFWICNSSRTQDYICPVVYAISFIFTCHRDTDVKNDETAGCLAWLKYSTLVRGWAPRSLIVSVSADCGQWPHIMHRLHCPGYVRVQSVRVPRFITLRQAGAHGLHTNATCELSCSCSFLQYVSLAVSGSVSRLVIPRVPRRTAGTQLRKVMEDSKLGWKLGVGHKMYLFI